MWRTVKGGSKHYVNKLVSALGEKIQSGTPIKQLSGTGADVLVKFENGTSDVFDEVILACHSDQSFQLLTPDAEPQKRALANIRYKPNDIYVHRDPELMPSRKAAWASWNVLKQHGDDICLTYWMNLLQEHQLQQKKRLQ